MMAKRITVEAWALFDVAHALRRALGDARNWRDFLTDAIRGKTHYHGLTLLPVARVRMRDGRCRQPVYRIRDVLEFIKEALRIAPPTSDPKKVRTHLIELDEDALMLPWPMRVAKVPKALT